MDRSSERWREDWALSPVEEGERAAAVDFASEIMDIMEQGILLWSPSGLCELHNARVYEVLGLEVGDLVVGTQREAFEASLIERVMVRREDLDKASEAATQSLPYSYDVSNRTRGSCRGFVPAQRQRWMSDDLYRRDRNTPHRRRSRTGP